MLAVVTAGCSSSGAMVGHQAGTTTAEVTGVVRGYGGPAILVHGKERSAIDGELMKNVTVTARRSDGSTTTTQTTASGTYVLRLPPGTYQLKSCSVPERIVLHAGQPATVNLRCDFP